MPRLPNPGSDSDNWGALLNEFLYVSHREDGTSRSTVEVFNVHDFGAKGDGTTDDTQALQTAIDVAGAAGGGVVYLPPANPYYVISAALIGQDDVTVIGTGYASFVKNVRMADFDATLANTAIFKLGGYESVMPLSVDTETVISTCGDEFAGQYQVSLNILTEANNFKEHDIVFIRSDAQIPKEQFSYHDIPYFAEINQIVKIGESNGLIELKYPLRDDYRGMRMIRSGTIPVPEEIRPKMLRGFRVENLRLETLGNHNIGLFSHGGCFECEFRNLWITGCINSFMLNVLARCTFENIMVRYSARLGEISYYSHDNTFRNIRASFARRDGVEIGNGWAINEGAHDNLFENILLNHGDAGTRSWVVGSGRRNQLINSNIISHSNTNGQAVVGLFAPGLDFKPKDCVIANTKIKVSGGDLPTNASFAIEVDSGGPYGGGNIIRDNVIEGLFKIAPIGLSRLDKRDKLGSQYGCENNIVEGNIHTTSDVGGANDIPILSMVAEYNNEKPSGNPPIQKIIDPDFRPNLIRNNLTRHRQLAIAEYDLGGFTSSTETIVRQYMIPRYSVGTHHRWIIEGAGRVSANATHDNKYARIFMLGSQLFSIGFDPNETGDWRFHVEIVGKHTRNDIVNNDTVIVRKIVNYTYVKNSTTVNGQTEYVQNSNQSDFIFDLRVLITPAAGTAQDSLIIDKFTVTPYGDEFSYVNWELI